MYFDSSYYVNNYLEEFNLDWVDISKVNNCIEALKALPNKVKK